MQRGAPQCKPSTTRPGRRRRPRLPSEPTDAFSVNDAGDVHRIVDLLPPGRHPGVKTLPNARAIEALYGHLTENSLPGPASTYPGQWRVLSDGTKIGLRQTSKFGGPTVEIWYPDGMKSDVHLSERPKGSQPSPVPALAPRLRQSRCPNLNPRQRRSPTSRRARAWGRSQS